mgnify:FL=1
MVSIETLLYIIKDNKVLLILKKKGLGQGFYNGVGGKVEPNETIEQAMIRECKEEVGIIPKNVRWMGLLEFYNDDRLYGYVYVFMTNEFEGTPVETDEAKPFWFDIKKVPYDKMWEDDRYWLPLVLDGKRILGRFWFEDNWKKLVRKEVYILNEVIYE